MDELETLPVELRPAETGDTGSPSLCSPTSVERVRVLSYAVRAVEEKKFDFLWERKSTAQCETKSPPVSLSLFLPRPAVKDYTLYYTLRRVIPHFFIRVSVYHRCFLLCHASRRSQRRTVLCTWIKLTRTRRFDVKKFWLCALDSVQFLHAMRC